MKDGDDYCGLACGELLEKQAELLNLCLIHAKYDPVFAPVMIDRLIAKCEEAKQSLLVGINNVE
jgi:hypothetical protein